MTDLEKAMKEVLEFREFEEAMQAKEEAIAEVSGISLLKPKDIQSFDDISLVLREAVEAVAVLNNNITLCLRDILEELKKMNQMRQAQETFTQIREGEWVKK
jgi:hypothetical protein